MVAIALEPKKGLKSRQRREWCDSWLWQDFFLEECENRIAEFGAVAVRTLHLSRELSCLKDAESSAERSVEQRFVQRGRCAVPERQRDFFCKISSQP